MAEFVGPVRGHPMSAPASAAPNRGTIARRLNATARVKSLAAQGVALNGGGTVQRAADSAAPIQLMPPKKDPSKEKKGNNKKQEKQKAAAKGTARAKNRKVERLTNSVQGYDTTGHSRKEIRAAIAAGNVNKMRAGHLSADSSQNMNAGTRKTITGLTGAIKAEKAKAKAEEHKSAGSDVDDGDEEDFELDVDYDDTGYKPPRDQDPPPPGASGAEGIAV